MCDFVYDLNLDNMHKYFSGNGSSEGRIIQRFPEADWESCPFTQSIELVTISDFRKTIARPYCGIIIVHEGPMSVAFVGIQAFV